MLPKHIILLLKSVMLITTSKEDCISTGDELCFITSVKKNTCIANTLIGSEMCKGAYKVCKKYD